MSGDRAIDIYKGNSHLKGKIRQIPCHYRWEINFMIKNGPFEYRWWERIMIDWREGKSFYSLPSPFPPPKRAVSWLLGGKGEEGDECAISGHHQKTPSGISRDPYSTRILINTHSLNKRETFRWKRDKHQHRESVHDVTNPPGRRDSLVRIVPSQPPSKKNFFSQWKKYFKNLFLNNINRNKWITFLNPI